MESLKIKKITTALSALLLLAAYPYPALATTQVFMSRSDGAIAAAVNPSITQVSSSNFNNLPGGDGVVPVAGTFKNLYVYIDAAMGVGNSFTITLRKNGSNQTLTCTISSGSNSCSDIAHTVSVAVGDKMNYNVTVSGTPSAVIYFSVGFSPSTSNEVIVFSVAGANTIATTIFYQGFGQGVGPNATESGRQTIFPEPGVASQLNIGLNAAPGSGTSYTFTTKQSSATTSQTCTIADTATTCADTTNSLTIAAGDRLYIAGMPANTPTATRLGAGLRFVPDIFGRFLLIGAGSSNQGTSSTTFIPVNGLRIVDSVAAGASSTEAVQPMVIKKMSVYLPTAPGASKTRTVTLVVNGTDSALTCAVTGSGVTTNTCTGNVTLNQGDMVYLRQDPSGTPANSAVYVTLSAIYAGDTPARSLRLFEGSRIKINTGKIIIYPTSNQ